MPELCSRCRVFFLRLPPAQREEATAEVLAQAFCCTLRAAQRGLLHRLTPFTLVAFFGRAYYAGQRMTHVSAGDVFSPARRKKRRLLLSDILADPKTDRPLENARRNIDYAEIFDREVASPKVRRVFSFFCETAGQGRQTDLARELGVSPPRICQLKAELADILAANGYEPPGRRPTERPSQRRRWQMLGWSGRRRGIPLNPGTHPAPRRRNDRSGRLTLMVDQPLVTSSNPTAA